MVEVFCGYKVTCLVVVTIDGNCRFRLTMRLNQHLTVLCQHILACILHPVRVFVSRLRTRDVCIMSFLISIIVALPLSFIALTILDADIEIAFIVFVGTIYITDIATTEDVTILTRQFLRGTYRTTMYMHLCLPEYITVGIERTTVTQIVVASTATKDITVYLAVEHIYACPTSLVDTLQGTDTVVLSGSLDDTTTDGCNLTTTKECITHYATIHLDVGNIHTTVVDIATTEDTATIVEAVGTVARPSLVVQLLLIVVRAHLYIVEVGFCCRYRVEVTITDKALVQGDVGCSEDRTTLTTAIGVTLDGWNTVNEAGTVFLTDDDVCFSKDVTRYRIADFSCVIAYATSPTATIDVTCRTTLDIGIGRSNEWLVEVISSNVVFIVYRTYGSCGIEVFCYSSSKQGDVGCSVHVAGIGSVGITQTATIGIGTAETTIIHIATDISALVDDDVGVVFPTVSG